MNKLFLTFVVWFMLFLSCGFYKELYVNSLSDTQLLGINENKIICVDTLHNSDGRIFRIIYKH